VDQFSFKKISLLNSEIICRGSRN